MLAKMEAFGIPFWWAALAVAGANRLGDRDPRDAQEAQEEGLRFGLARSRRPSPSALT